jgi:hypothetical protein
MIFHADPWVIITPSKKAKKKGQQLKKARDECDLSPHNSDFYTQSAIPPQSGILQAECDFHTHTQV